MTPFITTLSWDRPVLHRTLDSNQPLDPAYAEGEDHDYSWVWKTRLPPLGQVTLTLFPRGDIPATPAEQMARFIAHLGALGPDGRPAIAGAILTTEGAQRMWSDIATFRVRCAEGRRPPIHPCPITAYHGADPSAHATLSLHGDRITGTGALAGEWDARTYFAPGPRAQMLACEGWNPSSLRALLAIGPVAAALGAVVGWMGARGPGQAPLTLHDSPFSGMAPAVEALILRGLHHHGLEGLGEMTDARKRSLTPGHSQLARMFQARTHAATPAGRAKLAQMLTTALLQSLAYLQVWTPAPLPNPTGWAAAQVDALAALLGQQGTSAAYDTGLVYAQAVPLDTPDGEAIQAGRRLDLW